MISVARKVSIALALLAPGSAFAASDAAGEKFAQEVEAKCTDAASSVFRKPQIAVDPTGTQSYGVAIVYGKLKEGKERAAVICVMDKKTGVVELGSALGPDAVRVRKPKADDQDDKQDDDQ